MPRSPTHERDLWIALENVHRFSLLLKAAPNESERARIAGLLEREQEKVMKLRSEG